MRCPNIVGPSAAIAVAVVFGCFALFLAPCCLAAAAIDTEGLPQELLVPFNDLLPPLSDAELQTATTTTTTTEAPPVTVAPVSKPVTTTIAPIRVATAKPTKAATAQKLKKTQYQLDQKLQKQQPAVPILNLNPEVAPALPEAEAPVVTVAPEAAVTPEALVVPTTPVTPRPAPVTTKAPVKVPVKVLELKQAASTQHFTQVQAAQTATRQELQQHLQPQKQQQYKQQQQQKQQFAKAQPQAQHRFQPQVAAARTKVAPALPSPQHNAPAATQVNVDQLRQYLEYIYHPTTRRPSRGPLPTLTPFPRHLK